MRLICAGLVLFCLGTTWAQQQQQVDPAYLRQYYAQIQAQNQQQASQKRQDTTPIYEDQEQGFVPVNAPQGVKPRQFQVQRPVQPVIQQRQYSSSENQQPHYQQPSAYKAQKGRLSSEEEEEAYDPNPSYQFGFDVKDDEFTNYQNRKEVNDGGIIQGSYSVVDSDGFIRTVKYTAHPKDGFKAEVIREPTDIVIKMPEQVKAEQERGLRPSQYQAQHQQGGSGGASRYRLPNIPDSVRQQYQQ